MLTSLLTAAEPRLMPWPASVNAGNGSIAIDAGFNISVAGYSDKRLEAAIGRVLTRISRQTGTQFIGGGVKLTVQCNALGNLTLGEDESYQLDVTATGAKLNADTV